MCQKCICYWLIVPVPLLSPPQVWQEVERLLRRYTDVHLHFETQHVVFLQRVQPDLRMEHINREEVGSTYMNRICSSYFKIWLLSKLLNSLVEVSSQFLFTTSLKITFGSQFRQRFLTYSALFHNLFKAIWASFQDSHYACAACPK